MFDLGLMGLNFGLNLDLRVSEHGTQKTLQLGPNLLRFDLIALVLELDIVEVLSVDLLHFLEFCL